MTSIVPVQALITIENLLHAAGDEDVVQEFDESELLSQIMEVQEDQKEEERDGEDEGRASDFPVVSSINALKSLAAAKRILDVHLDSDYSLLRASSRSQACLRSYIASTARQTTIDEHFSLVYVYNGSTVYMQLSLNEAVVL